MTVTSSRTPTATTGVSEPRFRLDIQGMRALAVILVICAHAGVPYLAGGYVGVDVFFVISGFVITELLLRQSHLGTQRKITTFYARRARRIIPASMVALLATLVATYYW